jgi:hypothetical protein
VSFSWGLGHFGSIWVGEKNNVRVENYLLLAEITMRLNADRRFKPSRKAD